MRALFALLTVLWLLAPCLAWGQLASPTRSGSGGGGSPFMGTLGSTDNALVRADGTTGDTFQTTAITVDDTARLVMPTLGGLKWGGSQIYGTTGGLLTAVMADDITLQTAQDVLLKPGNTTTITAAPGGGLIWDRSASDPGSPGVLRGVLFAHYYASDFTQPFWRSNNGIRNMLAWTPVKRPARLATTANITLSGNQSIDGVACITGDLILVKDQTTPAENGLYVCTFTTWSRAESFRDATYDHIEAGMTVYVQEGSTQTKTVWTLTTTGAITVGTTGLLFENLY